MVKRILLVAGLLAGLCAGAAVARESYSLDRGWRFRLGDPEPFSLLPAGTPITRWEFLPVPGLEAGADPLTVPLPAESATGWRAVAVDEDAFAGRKTFGWFRTSLPGSAFNDPAIWFTMVDDNGTLYLNGTRVGRHDGWNEPFEVKLAPAW